jgi:hypothetical protein
VVAASSMFYVPAGHDGEGLPLLVDLVGFTGSGLSHTNWAGFHESLPERLDRLIGEQRMPPVVVAFPDCFSMGPRGNFLLQEMLPAIATLGRLSDGRELAFSRRGAVRLPDRSPMYSSS